MLAIFYSIRLSQLPQLFHRVVQAHEVAFTSPKLLSGKSMFLGHLFSSDYWRSAHIETVPSKGQRSVREGMPAQSSQTLELISLFGSSPRGISPASVGVIKLEDYSNQNFGGRIPRLRKAAIGLLHPP